LRELLKKFRGYEVKTEGVSFVLSCLVWCCELLSSGWDNKQDAFMAAFSREIDAIWWCFEVQMRLVQEKWTDELLAVPAACREYGRNDREKKLGPVFSGIRVRMGIHSGEPNCRPNPVTNRMDYFGPMVNRTARIADAPNGGQVVCTEEVALSLRKAMESKEYEKVPDLCKDYKVLCASKVVKIDELGAYPFKGIPQPVAVFQVRVVFLSFASIFSELLCLSRSPLRSWRAAFHSRLYALPSNRHV